MYYNMIIILELGDVMIIRPRPASYVVKQYSIPFNPRRDAVYIIYYTCVCDIVTVGAHLIHSTDSFLKIRYSAFIYV